MKDLSVERRRLLEELVRFHKESGVFNPHFLKPKMMERLGWTEGEFNIVQKSLGDRYCHFMDRHEGQGRYTINVSECLEKLERYRAEDEQAQRHGVSVRLMIWVAILASLLSTALGFWLRGLISISPE